MKAQKIDVKEEAPLKWPDGMERTRIQDRRGNAGWKKNRLDYQRDLVDELTRMGATLILITRSDNERMDPGVSVWFSMKKEDFSWQQGLGIENPAPTLDEINSAYREKVKPVHPDRTDGGDAEQFRKFTEWRNAAVAWVKGTHENNREFVMAIDQYNDVRLNFAALRMAVSYIRGLERVGAPSILTQTIGAFRAKLTGGSSGTTTA